MQDPGVSQERPTQEHVRRVSGRTVRGPGEVVRGIRQRCLEVRLGVRGVVCARRWEVGVRGVHWSHSKGSHAKPIRAGVCNGVRSACSRRCRPAFHSSHLEDCGKSVPHSAHQLLSAGGSTLSSTNGLKDSVLKRGNAARIVLANGSQRRKSAPQNG